MIKLLLFANLASAGWWGDFCEKYLVAHDPYQFEQTSEDWLLREVDRLTIRENFNKLTPDETQMLEIMRAELRRRKF